ncbi:MAG: hypothetical protein ACE5JZ_03840 [Kiloniellales bacterium]
MSVGITHRHQAPIDQAAPAPAGEDLPAWAWLWFPPMVLVLAAVLRAIDADTYRQAMESELGVVENATALLLVPAVVFGLMALSRRRALPARWLGPWLMLLVAGSVYLAGEEVSWGQNWFGWATPGWLAALNDQVETNLHNTSSWLDQKPRHLFLLWVVAAGLMFPLARRVRGWSFDPSTDWRSWFWPTGIVVPTAFLAAFIRLPEWLGDNVESLREPLLLIRYAEYQEYFFALFLALYLGSFYRRLRRQAAA